MFNYVEYQANGFYLRIRNPTDPSTIYIEVNFSPLTDKHRVKKDVLMVFDLDDILRMKLPAEAIKIATELNSTTEMPAKQSQKPSALLLYHVTKHLKKKGIKLYF